MDEELALELLLEEEIASEQGNSTRQELTGEQKERIQKNKERARALKEQRRQSKPYDRPPSTSNSSSSTGSSALSSREQRPQVLRNSHAGFMFEEDESATQKHKYHRVEEDGKCDATLCTRTIGSIVTLSHTHLCLEANCH